MTGKPASPEEDRRLLDLITAYIEETIGARRENACGDYYIAGDLSEHVILSDAKLCRL